MVDMHPNDFCAKLCEITSTRKKRTLSKVNEICKKHAGLGNKDFSIATIGGLLESNGILTEQGLRNKNSEEYRALIKAWAEFTNGSMKKTKSNKTNSINDDILASISDPTLRAIFGITIAENKKLKNELSILKNLTTLTIDMRKTKENAFNEDPNTILISSSYRLTDVEIQALKDAISDEFIKDQGWTVYDNGKVKQKGAQVYRTGYVSAIKKILNECEAKK